MNLVDIKLLLAWYHTQAARIREDSDRGEMLNTAIVIGLLAAIAITIGAILLAKATTAANNVKTQ